MNLKLYLNKSVTKTYLYMHVCFKFLFIYVFWLCWVFAAAPVFAYLQRGGAHV